MGRSAAVKPRADLAHQRTASCRALRAYSTLRRKVYMMRGSTNSVSQFKKWRKGSSKRCKVLRAALLTKFSKKISLTPENLKIYLNRSGNWIQRSILSMTPAPSKSGLKSSWDRPWVSCCSSASTDTTWSSSWSRNCGRTARPRTLALANSRLLKRSRSFSRGSKAKKCMARRFTPRRTI